MNIVIDTAAAKKEYRVELQCPGAYARLAGANGSRARVIGIVGNVRNRGLGEATEAEVYVRSCGAAGESDAFCQINLRNSGSGAYSSGARVIQGVDRVIDLLGLTAEGDCAGLCHRRAPAIAAHRVLRLSVALLLAALWSLWSGVLLGAAKDGRDRHAHGARRGRPRYSLLGPGDGLKMAAYGVAAGGLVVIAAVFLLKAAIFGIRIDDPLPFLYSTGIVAASPQLACSSPVGAPRR